MPAESFAAPSGGALEDDLKGLAVLESVLGLPAEKVAEMKAQIEAKYAGNETARD